MTPLMSAMVGSGVSGSTLMQPRRRCASSCGPSNLSGQEKAMKGKIGICAFLLASTWAPFAMADTSLELLHGWHYNNDFNGDKERTVLTIKTFQPWTYGT